MAYRALIVPDARFIHDNVASSANGSDYLEVGPRPGVPVDQGDVRSRMTLQASGTIPATGDVTVTIVDSGFPGDGARFKFRSETAGTTYGYDGPAMITGYESVNFVADAATAFRTDHPHAIRLLSGDVLIACRIAGSTATGSNTEYNAGIYKLTVSTGALAYVSRAFSANDDQVGAQMKSPCLLQLPSGRVLCFDWDVTSTSPGLQLMVAYSDDDGATWSDYSRRALRTPIDDADYDVAQYSRIRAAYSNGQILLLAQLYDAGAFYLAQFASDDLGVTFTTVNASAGAGFSVNVAPRTGGGFLLAFVVGTTTTCTAVGSAFEDLETQGVAGTITQPDATDEVCLWVGEDNTFWAAGTSTVDNEHIWLMTSKDEGDSWMDNGSLDSAAGATPSALNDIDAGIWMGEEANLGFLRYTFAEYRGKTIMVAEPDPETDTHGASSLLALYLGGHSNINLPRSPRSAYGRDNDLVGWRFTWVALEDPGDFTAWTRTSTGTPTVDLDANGWDIQLDATENEYYSAGTSYIDTADVSATDYLFLLELTPNTGGSTSTDDIACRIRLADGTDDLDLTVRLTTTGFAVFDNNAGSNAFTAVTASLTNTQILVFVKGSSGVVRAYYRTGITPGLPLRTFTTAGSGTLTNDTGSPAANGILRWGSISAVAGATRSHWRIVAYTSVPSTYGYDPSLTSCIGARHLSTVPVTMGNGTRIAGVDGPAVVGDEWNIVPEFDYPIKAMFPQIRPSPRQTFQTEQRGPTLIAVALDNELTGLGSSSIGLSLWNTNIRSFSLQAYDGGSWGTVASFTHGYSGLKFTRRGDLLVVNTGATTTDGTPWLPHHRFAGGYVQLDDGGGTVTYARVISNTSGRWSQESGLRAALYLHPDDVAGAPTSGTAWLVPPNGTFLLHDQTSAYSRWRLNIANADYPDADNDRIRIGTCIFGPLVYFGRQYSHGRTIELQPNTELQTTVSGVRAARNRGPARRRIAFSWLEGVDMTELADATTTSPESFTATTYAGQAVAAPADTPLLIEGIVERLQGAALPVVYLPSVSKPSGSGGSVVTDTISHPNGHHLVRVVSTARREAFLGNEAESELARITDVVLEEEV